MYMRDKNGEHASERVARKFLDGDFTRPDCHTATEVADGGRVYMTLYGTRIAYMVSGVVYILSGFPFSGSALTKARQAALANRALRLGLKVRHD
jgi:hypothetical protein